VWTSTTKRKTIYNKAARRQQLNLKTYWTIECSRMLKYNNKSNLDIWSGHLGMCQKIQYLHNSEKSVKDSTYDCQRSMVCAQYNTSWRLEYAVSKWRHKTKKHKIPQKNRRTCKRTNSTVTRTTQWKKTKKELASRPTRRLMRNYFWIILFTLYWTRAN
jgi:hypothetical protein